MIKCIECEFNGNCKKQNKGLDVDSGFNHINGCELGIEEKTQNYAFKITPINVESGEEFKNAQDSSYEIEFNEVEEFLQQVNLDLVLGNQKPNIGIIIKPVML